MRFSVSDTAEYGDYVSGPRVTEGAKAAMKDVLSDIQSGSFANRWIAVQEAGGGEFQELRKRDREHQIEQVGEPLRAMMSWLRRPED
jgi:ketol-acid reductoisomerase